MPATRVAGIAMMRKLSLVILVFASAVAVAQTPAAPTCQISGRVTAGNVPLPGVTISAANSLTGKKASTSTEIDGTYTLAGLARGRYVVRAELAAFAPETKEIVVNPENCHPSADLTLTLLSRVQRTEGQQQAMGASAASLGGRGFQNLSLSSDLGAMAQEADSSGGGTADSPSGNPGTFNPDATETVSVSGNNGQTNDAMFGGNNADLRERMEDIRARAAAGQLNGGDIQEMRGMMGGGPGGGFGGGPGGGGPGGPGGANIMIVGGGRGGRGRFNINQPHGNLFYSASNAALDAAPYSLAGAPSVKPAYMQQRFGASVGGPLKIPHIYDAGTKTFFFVNYTGNRSHNPFDVFSTVPTAAERAGDFSGVTERGRPVQLYDPATGLPFVNNQIPAGMINGAAAGLLNYLPLPNLPGTTQNFHYVTSAENNNDNLNIRVMHNFGAGGMGGPGGGPVVIGGPGGMSRGGRTRNNINFGLHFQRGSSVSNGAFPTIQGRGSSTAWNVPFGYVRSMGRLTNMFNFTFSRNQFDSTNLYSGLTNIAGQLGILGVSQNPFDWGLPSLSFTDFTGINDLLPRHSANQTYAFSDNMVLRHGKHNLRWGGDFRRIQQNNQTDKNARGSFVFTGLYTSQFVNGAPVAGTGLDFADFLLGDAQQASVQYGANNYHLRQNSWDLYAQDDWRVRGNLTIQAGLRYEYVSPFSELNHRIANLDVNPTFTAVVPVCSVCAAGVTGPFTGVFPASLVSPDRNNFAPRVGIAWKALKNTVVRAGYGINYNTTQYGNIVQNLAFQPPYTTTYTNIGGTAAPLPLQNAFATAQAASVTNNYGVDHNYRLGYVQIWNLDIQRELTRSLLLNIGYTGTKGTALDIVRAPNREPNGGLRIPGVQPFLWETSQGSSILHGLNVRLRKRMSHGVSVGGTYVFSKSIDNASSIGGGSTVVAQNDQDLAAERGLSSFDQRHRLSGDYILQLPFGDNRRWLASPGIANRLFGDWQWQGTFTIASGIPYTARVLGSFADVASGVNGTLRADATGQPIALANPSIAEFFNTAAFTLPLSGQFGTAGRNTIEGPHTLSFNMSLAKEISLGETRGLELRVQGSNVFNTPQWSAIDAVVNSPTFGRVTSVGSMRTLQMLARFHF